MLHTTDTVRTACERAGIILEQGEIVAVPSVGPFVTTWRTTTTGGGRVTVGETRDGELWYDGRCIFSAPEAQGAVDPVAPKAILEEQVRALRDALAPFAAFGEALKLDACEDSDVMHTAAGVRVLAGDYRRAVAALAALP